MQKTLFVLSLSFFLLVSPLLFGVDYGGNAGILGQANPSHDTVHDGVTSHRANAAELSALKNYAGTYNAAENYCRVVGGHGTGLAPPSAEQWTQLAENTEFVDAVAANGAVPTSVDLSASPYFPPIGNQGPQGSCVAWSLGYYTKTFQEAQEHNWKIGAAKWQNQTLTPEYQGKIMSPAFIYNLQAGGVDDGIYYSDAVGLICNVGCCTIDRMPYIVSDFTSWPSEEAWIQAAYYRGDSGGIQNMPLNTDQGIINLKNWVTAGHLATISVDADKFANLSRADVWTTDSYTNPYENHANTVVGYDDNFNYTEAGVTRFGAFKVANSWGVGGWENVSDGFYWISYTAMKQSVTYCMLYNDLDAYTPSLFASFSISHPLSGECQIQIGAGDPKTATVWKNFNRYISGGSYPFSSGKIVLDITEFKATVGNMDGQSFYMGLYDSGTAATGVINSFAINNISSTDAPIGTVNGKSVYVYASLPSPSPSATPTATPKPSPTATPPPSPTPTITPSPNPTPTTTPTPTTATPTHTPTPTQTVNPVYPTATTQPTTNPIPSATPKTTPTDTPANQQTTNPTKEPTPTPNKTIPFSTEDVQLTLSNFSVVVIVSIAILAAVAVMGIAAALKRSRHGST